MSRKRCHNNLLLGIILAAVGVGLLLLMIPTWVIGAVLALGMIAVGILLMLS